MKSFIAPEVPVEERLLKTVELDKSFTDYQLVTLDEASVYHHLQKSGGFAAVRFQIADYDWEFDLEPNEIRSADYKLRVQGPDGVVTLPRSQVLSYKGRTRDERRSEVRITVTEDVIYGMVADSIDAVFFQSAYLTDAKLDRKEALVFKGTDGAMPDEYKCGVEGADITEALTPAGSSDANTTDATATGAKSSAGRLCYEIKLSIASDWLMYEKYGRDAGAVEARNVAIMNAVSSDYSGAFADDYEFVIVEQYISTCESCDPWTHSLDPFELFYDFTDWGPTGFAETHDLGQLWSGRKFTGKIKGLGWIGGFCSDKRYHMVRDYTTNAEIMRSVTSHEIGHNFHCLHDRKGSNFFMSPNAASRSKWSAESVDSVDAYVSRMTCLQSKSCGGQTALDADFVASSRSICTEGSVSYTDRSEGAETYSWFFPGGSPSSSAKANPEVRYNTPGNFAVELTISNESGTITERKVDHISVAPPPVAGLNFKELTPLTVQFENLTVYANTYLWEYGDGNTSTKKNPKHTYAQKGTYEVTLTATSECSSSMASARSAAQ